MADDVEKLVVLIEAQTNAYQKSMDKLQQQTSKALKNAEKSVTGLNAKLEGLSRTVETTAKIFGIAFGARELVDFIKRGIEAGEAIGEMAAKLGITTTAYQELTYVAEQAGASQDDVNAAFKGMIKVLGEAADGSKTAQDAFAKLGISFDTIKGQSPDQVFELILDRLSKIHDPLQRGAAELQIFGKSGLQLGEMAQLGAKGIDALKDAAHQSGLVLDDDVIQKAKEAGDKLKIIEDAASKAGIRIAADFLPAIDAVAKLLTSDAFQHGLDVTATTLGTIVKFLAEHPEALKILAGAAGGAVAGSMIGGVGAIPGAVLGAGATATYGLLTQSPPAMTQDEFDARYGSPRPAEITVHPAHNDNSAGWKPTPDIDAQQKAYEKLAASIQLETANLTASDREQFIANEVARLGATATQKQKDSIAALAGTLYDAKERYKALNEAAQFFSDTVGNSFIDAITGAESFNDALKDIVTSLEKAVLQAALLGEGPLAGLFGTQASSSGGVGGLFGSLLSLFGGFRAGGGSVNAGKAYVVGEKRPELFIPSTGGRIAPSVGAGGGISVAIHQSFDFSGADPATVVQLQRQMPQVVVAARDAAVQAVRQGLANNPRFLAA